MIAALMTDLWPYLAAAAAVFGALWKWGRSKKTEGREETYMEVLKDTHDRQERGREAASDLRGADRDDLVDRLRRNDGEW